MLNCLSMRDICDVIYGLRKLSETVIHFGKSVSLGTAFSLVSSTLDTVFVGVVNPDQLN